MVALQVTPFKEILQGLYLGLMNCSLMEARVLYQSAEVKEFPSCIGDVPRFHHF